MKNSLVTDFVVLLCYYDWTNQSPYAL